MRGKVQIIIFACAALLLGSCQFRTDPEPDSTLPDISVSAAPVAAPAPGSYYNSHTDVGLVLDAEGAFAMFSGGDSVKGTYSLRGDDVLFLSGVEETLARPEDGGLIFEDMPGAFLPVGVAESFSALGVMLSGDREYSDNGDGTWLVQDYALGLAFRYPGDMSCPEGMLPDAAVVWDGESGYVVGRNVTESLSGAAEADYLKAYMEQTVPADYKKLRNVDYSWESFQMLTENIPGRVASAEGVLLSAMERVYVKVIMYTSTYADGTVNYICKGFYAQEDDTAAFNALANGVLDMTAVRRN